MRRLTCTVPEDMDGQRVDAILRKMLGVSGGSIRRAKYAEDGITVDGLRQRVSYLAKAGQQVSIVIDDTAFSGESADIQPEEGPIDIVYEDQDIVVVNKPAGMVVYRGPRHCDGTLANRLMFHFQQKGIDCSLHPVNRLDMSTSGLIVFAKNPHAHFVLQNQLHTGDFQRSYLALCQGVPNPAQGRIDAPIGMVQSRDAIVKRLLERGAVSQDDFRFKMPCSAQELGMVDTRGLEGDVVDTRKLRNVYGVCPDGKPAATNYEVLRTVSSESVQDACSLVRLVLETGRTHQIRIHMAHIGNGLLGDEVYGVESDLIDRAALHSFELRITHPITGEPIQLSAPLPDDMRKVLGD